MILVQRFLLRISFPSIVLESGNSDQPLSGPQLLEANVSYMDNINRVGGCWLLVVDEVVEAVLTGNYFSCGKTLHVRRFCL